MSPGEGWVECDGSLIENEEINFLPKLPERAETITLPRNNVSSACYNENGIIAYCVGSNICYSTDIGVTWNTYNVGTSYSLCSCTYVDGYFYFAGTETMSSGNKNGIYYTTNNFSKYAKYTILSTSAGNYIMVRIEKIGNKHIAVMAGYSGSERHICFYKVSNGSFSQDGYTIKGDITTTNMCSIDNELFISVYNYSGLSTNRLINIVEDPITGSLIREEKKINSINSPVPTEQILFGNDKVCHDKSNYCFFNLSSATSIYTTNSSILVINGIPFCYFSDKFYIYSFNPSSPFIEISEDYEFMSYLISNSFSSYGKIQIKIDDSVILFFNYGTLYKIYLSSTKKFLPYRPGHYIKLY